MITITDNFNRANTAFAIGTPSSGGKQWRSLLGNWGIVSNTGYQSAGSGNCKVVVDSGVAKNLTITVTSATAGASGGIVLRAVDVDNFIVCQFRSAGTMYMFKCVAGSFTELGTHYTGAVSDGDVFAVAVDGSNNIVFSQNGVSRVTATDATNATATKHGLWSNADAGDATRFDDFSIASSETGFPGFTRLGTIIPTPAWMSDVSIGGHPFFPRLFNNDTARSALSGLPATSFSMLYSSDHAGTDGYIGRADADNIEGPWTDVGNYIHTSIAQRETPMPVFDPDIPRVNVYVHDNVSDVTFGFQQTHLLTTPDLSTLTDQGACIHYGDHSGYAYVERIAAGNWRALHGYLQQDATHPWIFTKSTSTDGVNWTKGRTFHSRLNHIAPTGYIFSGEPSWFTYDGQEYVLSTLFSGGVGHAIVAIPVASDSVSPIGGYITLVERGETGEFDSVNIRSVGQVFFVDGVPYIPYIGSDGTDIGICLAKLGAGISSQSTPRWPMLADGDLFRETGLTTHLAWDAINNTLPASITKVLEAGTDNSSHVAASYYELKTGSGSSQVIQLRTTDAFDPADFETIECEWVINSQDTTPTTVQRSLQLWFNDSDDFSDKNGLLVIFGPSGIADEREAGEAFIYAANSAVASEGTAALGYAVPLEVNQYARNNRFSLKLRIHDHGNRASLFIDNSCAWHRDVSADGIAYGAGGKFSLRIASADTNPQLFVRLESVTVRSYDVPVPGSGRTGMNNRTLRPY